MCSISFIGEVLKAKDEMENVTGFDLEVFSKLLAVFNDMNGEADPDGAPIFQIDGDKLKYISDGAIHDICCIDDIESYTLTPIGIRIYDKEPGHEYILGMVRRDSDDYTN